MCNRDCRACPACPGEALSGLLRDRVCEKMIVGRSIAALGIGTPAATAEEPIADHIIWLDLNQIVHAT